MSYNTAENYPVPFGFISEETLEIRERKVKSKKQKHEAYKLKPGQSYMIKPEEKRMSIHRLLHALRQNKGWIMKIEQNTITRIK